MTKLSDFSDLKKLYTSLAQYYLGATYQVEVMKIMGEIYFALIKVDYNKLDMVTSNDYYLSFQNSLVDMIVERYRLNVAQLTMGQCLDLLQANMKLTKDPNDPALERNLNLLFR